MGLGMLGALAVGVVMWYLIPKSRRGRVVGLSETNIEPLEAGARITV